MRSLRGARDMPVLRTEERSIRHLGRNHPAGTPCHAATIRLGSGSIRLATVGAATRGYRRRGDSHIETAREMKAPDGLDRAADNASRGKDTGEHPA
jgi:hypothetical protein